MKQKKVFIIYGLILSLIVILVGGFYIIKTINQNTGVGNVSVKTDDYYSIRNNATVLQKDLYKELIAAIEAEEKDEKVINELLAQNFVADFYTWNNKFRRNDIGGLQFVDESIRVNVYQNAQETFYNDFYYYLDKKQKKDTLEVTELTVVDSSKIDYFVFDKDGSEEIYDEVTERYVMGDYIDAYEVKLTWKYKDSGVLTPSDYDIKANIIITKNEKGLPMIVEVNHNEEN